MILSQDEVNVLTQKRSGSREALESWIKKVDAVLASQERTSPTGSL